MDIVVFAVVVTVVVVAVVVTVVAVVVTVVVVAVVVVTVVVVAVHELDNTCRASKSPDLAGDLQIFEKNTEHLPISRF